MSSPTKKYRNLSYIFGTLSILLNITPFAVYAIIALADSNFIYQKITLSMTVLIVAIMTLVCLINKVAMKSRLWIILIGIYVCLGEIITPLIIIAVCQIVDELIVSPLYKNFKNKKIINKEIDKRL